MVRDTKEWRIPKKQHRCIICNRLITLTKDDNRKCCSNCKRDYIQTKKAKWVTTQKLTNAQILQYLKDKAKKRKRKYDIK